MRDIHNEPGFHELVRAQDSYLASGAKGKKQVTAPSVDLREEFMPQTLKEGGAGVAKWRVRDRFSKARTGRPLSISNDPILSNFRHDCRCVAVP